MDQEADVIRDQMQETRESLTEKIEALEDQVAGTVQTAASSVAETVDTVTGTVKDTVENLKENVHDAMASVREMLDLPLQVERHPWGMFLGGIAAGFIGTQIAYRQARSAPTAGTDSFIETPRSAPKREGPSLIHWLASTYHDELVSLKALGIGAVAGLVRDMISQSLPQDLGSKVGEWVDSVTSKIGGKPIQGPVLAGAHNGHSEDGPRGRS